MTVRSVVNNNIIMFLQSDVCVLCVLVCYTVLVIYLIISEYLFLWLKYIDFPDPGLYSLDMKDKG